MDREKVIKGKEHLDAIMEVATHLVYPDYVVVQEHCLALLAMLKEQEAKWIYGEDETGVDGWHCSYCGFFEPWFYEFTDDIDFIRFYGFCPSCGKRMTSYTGKPTQECR